MTDKTEEIRSEILRKLYEQRNAEENTGSVVPTKAVVPTTAADIGCDVSYNDLFDIPCETVGLKNFSLDSYFNQLDKVDPAQKVLIPEVDTNYQEQPQVLWMIAWCLVNDSLALLQGYQGTGKTSGLEYVCAKMKAPLMAINCTSTQDSASIAGSMQVVNDGGVSITKYVGETDFMVNMQKGVVCLLDEIFWAPDDLRGGTLMRFRDKKHGVRYLTAPEDSSGSVGVPVHEASRLFYADNTLGLGDNADKFAARYVADTAFLDGINFVIKVDYLPEKQEIDILRAKVKDLPAQTAKELIQLAGLVRKGFAAGDLPITLSLRTLTPIAEACVLLDNPVQALQYGYYNKLSEDSERDCFKSMMGTVGFNAKYGQVK